MEIIIGALFEKRYYEIIDTKKIIERLHKSYLLHEAAKPRQVSRDAEEEDVQMEAKALNIIHTLEFP